jgi:hypothetical protein
MTSNYYTTLLLVLSLVLYFEPNLHEYICVRVRHGLLMISSLPLRVSLFLRLEYDKYRLKQLLRNIKK